MSAEALRDVLRFLNTREFNGDDDENPIRTLAMGAHDDGGPLHIVDNEIVAGYATLLLGSTFQPIITRDERVLGYKALVTARSASRHEDYLIRNDEKVVDMPRSMLAASDRTDIIYRDRLTRTMHALNYLAREFTGDLHMSVNPQHLQAVHQNHGEVFEQILARCGLQPDRIVLEIPEYAVTDKQHLRAAIAAWQRRRYRIAIDRFGADHAQLTRVISLKPDIVKFDGEFIAKLSATTASAKKLEKMIEQISANGMHSMATGIDDEILHSTAQRYSFFALQGQWLTERVRNFGLPRHRLDQKTAHQ